MTIRFHRQRPEKETRAGMSRRMFLMTSTMAGITTTMMGRAAFAASGALTEPQKTMLLRMIEDIYPHPDVLQPAHYQAIAATVLQTADEDKDNAKTLTDGLTAIEEQAQALFGKAYIDIDDADAREGLLRHFQNEAFFQGVRWTAYFGIYNNKDIWPLFGYEGSSVEYGGYIERGFSDITFVPEGPTLEQRLAEVQG